MMSPLVSIIIPIYNAELYIAGCLESVIGQSYKQLELILVDDGSRDRSGEICDEYSAKYDFIKTIHIENGGVSRARNIGMQHVTGDYLSFIDSDDTIEPTFIENFVAAIESDIFIYIQGCSIIDRDKKVQKQTYSCTGIQGIDTIFRENNLCGQGYAWAKFYYVPLLRSANLEFDTSIKFSEDLLFILNCLLYADRIKYLPESGYNYFLREGNASSKSYSVESELRCLLKYKSYIQEISSKYGVDLFSIGKVGEIFTMLFSRVRNSMYGDRSFSKSDRISILRQFGDADLTILKRYQYISNVVVRIGNGLLFRGLLSLYDAYFSLIYSVKR